jgi:hypothetical protein
MLRNALRPSEDKVAKDKQLINLYSSPVTVHGEEITKIKFCGTYKRMGVMGNAKKMSGQNTIWETCTYMEV